jgi:hypothetical protein
MLIKYILLLLVILAIYLILNNSSPIKNSKKNNNFETFESGPIIFELLKNTEIDGSFTPESLLGAVDIKLGISNIKFNIGGKSIIINDLHKIDFIYSIGTNYNYKIIAFPLENFIILMLNNKVIYSKYLNTVKLSKNKLEVLVENGHTITSITTVNSPLKFLGISNTLYRINNEKYDIEMNNKYYSLRNIKNNLYLGVEKPDRAITPDNKLVILVDKERYIVVNELGKLMDINIEKIVNADTWLTYGSTINIINNKKQYLSSNKNLKYDFKGASGLSAVYCDNIASKELISWTIRGLKEGATKPLVKTGNSIYLSNNNMYLQIIHGNPTANKIGLEVSVGNLKNDNSKWIIMTLDNSRLFRTDSNVYLYNPKHDVYLYNTGKDFTLVKMVKGEVVGLDVKDTMSIWTISNIILPTINTETEDSLDYYTFNKEKVYINTQEYEWKKLLDSENEKVKKGLITFNKLKGISDDIEAGINKVKVNIDTVLKTKCASKTPLETDLKYDIIYENNPKKSSRNNIMNTDQVTPCDYISIESIPEDKKITDFKINELSGFNRLQLKK